ncbi:MAG: hypothetical protein RLY86_519 [Pseudomonadota bacterium]|jgi:uncharacterized protein YbjT (DUF2867 family)
MTVAIIGGTGKVGHLTALHLAARRVPVTVISRTAPAAPLPPGVRHVPGDLADPASLAAGLAGADSLFLITPFIAAETTLGLGAVEAALAAGVRRIVYMAIMNLEVMARVPHFGNKVPIKQRVMAAGVPFTVLEPNFFQQNDFMYAGAMLGPGVYPMPLGRIGLNAVDVRDIAPIAALALATDRLDGRVLPIPGPEPISGPSAAATYARLLGRPIHYVGDDLDGFVAMLDRMMPGGADDWLKHDLRTMAEENLARGNPADADQIAAVEDLLGRPLRRHAALAEEVVAAGLMQAPPGGQTGRQAGGP